MDDREKHLRELAIVDDEEEFRAFVRRVAEPLGWRVSEFGNGNELFDALSGSLRPELILLDMVMPELDGIETISRLGHTTQNFRIVLITGRVPIYTDAAGDLARAIGVEIVDVLQKPIRLAQLRAVLGPARA